MSKKKNFTLSEVLITIVIIGAVAAITIPALINIISNKSQEAQTKTIEARFLDGLNRYNAMEDGLSKHYETTKEFLDGLSKYYKMSQICDSDEITKCILSAQGTPFIIAFKKNCIWDNGQAMTKIQDSDCVSLMYLFKWVNLTEIEPNILFA